MAEALYRWNGSEWVLVTAVNTVVVQGGGGLKETVMVCAVNFEKVEILERKLSVI